MWDPHGKQMIGYLDFYQCFSNFWVKYETHKWPIMQYTGLKDKNGQEIYEGDIVIIGPNLIPTTMEVVFTSGQFIYSRDDRFTAMSYPEYANVIGNIYENPELLNPSKDTSPTSKST
jgi:hypothetical protein